MEQNIDPKLLQAEKRLGSNRSRWLLAILLALILIGGAGGYVYWKTTSARVYTETASITAPTTNLTPTVSGQLEAVYVQEGDVVPANTPVARVGTEVLETTQPSLIISVQNQIGTTFGPGQPVVTVINPQDLRVDGQVEEDKGLSNIQVGDRAIFTVDGFSKNYEGVVDEVSPTSHAGDVVFNISDQRQISSFDVKVRFDTTAYPELKNGMSAKLWIYKQ